MRFAKFKDLQVQKINHRYLVFTYSIISAVLHQFHEVVASDNSRRDNIHETHFDTGDLEIKEKSSNQGGENRARTKNRSDSSI